MKFFIKSILKNATTNWRSNLLIFANLAICTAVIFIMLQNFSFSSKSYSSTLTDFVIEPRYTMEVQSDEYDSDRANENNMYKISKLVRDEIFRSNRWTAYPALCNAELRIKKTDLPANFPENAQDLNAGYTDLPEDQMIVHAYVICGKEYFEAGGLEVSEGRSFSDADFDVVDGPLPILLGHDFIGCYKVGDVIDSFDDQVVIVGFLKENSFLIGGTGSAIAASVIFPQGFPRSADTTSEMIQRERLFFTFYGGVLAIKDTRIDAQAEINRITSKYGFYPIRVSTVLGDAVGNTAIVSAKNLTLLFVLAVATSVLSIVSVGTILYRRTKKEMPTICIYLLSGIQMWKIALSLFIEICFWGILAVFPTIAISIYEFRSLLIPIWQIVGYAMLIVILSFLPVLKFAGQVNLDRFIRSRSE